MEQKDKKLENQPLMNENILSSQVLLVISKEEKQIISKQEALEKARKAGLDLLCVAPSENPPVCKLVDYQKINYYRNKKKKNKENISKEMRFSFNIKEHDLRIKLNRVYHWIEQGATVKISLILVSKEKTQYELSREKCQKIISYLQSQSPKIELKDSIRQEFNRFSFFLYKKKQ